jgi:hypothetical protein
LVFSSADIGNGSKTLLASENTQPDRFDEFRSGWWISAVPDRPACDPDGLMALIYRLKLQRRPISDYVDAITELLSIPIVFEYGRSDCPDRQPLAQTPLPARFAF